MVAAEEHSALREAAVVAYADYGQVVDPYFFAYPYVVADAELPREFDVHGGLDDYASAYLRAECPEQGDF